MNIQNLKRITPYEWEAKSDTNKPIRLYASQNILENMEDKVLEQIQNVANLPGLVDAAMTMPDAHWGYGFPIGGVAAFDLEANGIISAGGVGFDISCGIRCLRTNLTFDNILPHLNSLANELYKRIPAGVGRAGHLKLSNNELNHLMKEGAVWAINKGYGDHEDLAYIEEKGCMQNAKPEAVSSLAKERQQDQLGSLGSGNHYLEVQVVDKIFDVQAAKAFGIFENQILISIHCGSRGLGHQIGSEFLVEFAKTAQKLGIHLAERELACAPIQSPEGQRYLGAMNAAINCALANRQVLTHLTREVFHKIIPKAELKTLYDVSHNTCKPEKHLVNGKERLVYVHRKGATRAFGPFHPELPSAYQKVGQPVIIGGSMGTSSYILAGNPADQNRAFASASHGAGRSMSRRQALKQWQGKEIIKELANKGIIIMSGSMRGIAEEAPEAYKDVDIVAAATEGGGLARRVASLKPKICIKG